MYVALFVSLILLTLSDWNPVFFMCHVIFCCCISMPCNFYVFNRKQTSFLINVKSKSWVARIFSNAVNDVNCVGWDMQNWSFVQHCMTVMKWDGLWISIFLINCLVSYAIVLVMVETWLCSFLVTCTICLKLEPLFSITLCLVAFLCSCIIGTNC